MTLPLNLETPELSTLPESSGLTPDGTVLGPSGTAGTAGAPTAEPGAEEETTQVALASVPAVPVLKVVVHGMPAPQGSKRGYVVNGRAVMVESSKKVKPWREAVKHAALDAHAQAAPLAGPLMITVVYTLPRAKSHYRTGRNAHLLRDNAPRWPAGKPDGDKLDRATLDALTDAGVWLDDAQVVVRVSVKSYPAVHPKALQTPGAYIRVTVLPPAPTKDV